jgi:hypothetical protein
MSLFTIKKFAGLTDL